MEPAVPEDGDHVVVAGDDVPEGRAGDPMLVPGCLERGQRLFAVGIEDVERRQFEVVHRDRHASLLTPPTLGRLAWLRCGWSSSATPSHRLLWMGSSPGAGGAPDRARS